MRLFTERGYEGASLADIIEEIGIKKSSIYNHYKSKDDLFLSIYDSCVTDELYHMKQFFGVSLEPHEIFPYLKLYIEKRSHRILNVLSAKFLFRFNIFPPYHLKEVLLEKAEIYFTTLSDQFLEFLKILPFFATYTEQEATEFVHLYVTLQQGIIMDGFMGGGYCTKERLELGWAHFESKFQPKTDVSNKSAKAPF